MSKVQYRRKSIVRTRRAAKKYQPKLMDGDCVLAVPGGTVTANAAGTLLPAIHSLTFFQEGEIYKTKDSALGRRSTSSYTNCSRISCGGYH
eukprot:SAG11_NODE_34677_length_270_cov_1.491228_1_plen_90_part_11